MKLNNYKGGSSDNVTSLVTLTLQTFLLKKMHDCVRRVKEYKSECQSGVAMPTSRLLK